MISFFIEDARKTSKLKIWVFRHWFRAIATNKKNAVRVNIGGLAQLVQSTWFTPRGSLVRIQYSPQKKGRHLSAFFILVCRAW